MKLPTYLLSSYDPKKVSLTIRGVSAGIITLVLVLAPFLNWTVSAEQFDNVLDSFDSVLFAIQGLIIAAGTVYSGVAVLWGGLRKLAIGFKLMKPKA